jgi:hypothetical protein
MSTLRPCRDDEREMISRIINAAAEAYRCVIPDDCWHDPYMALDEIEEEIAAGVVFWGYEENGSLAGVMGIQSVRDVDFSSRLRPAGQPEARNWWSSPYASAATEHAAHLDWHLGSCELGNSLLHAPRLRVGRAIAQGCASQDLLGRPGSTDGGFGGTGESSSRRNVTV